MEQSISSLAFKGSIGEAIVEAKTQKKLFVVYVSGENPDSTLLDTSTWTHLNVAESLSKYCILLHISEGSLDAVQFSALYPQKPAPCITVIGYNGVQLWQNEGYVTAEVLASTLEKSWLSLHIQETTATFLTAALASRESGQSTSPEVGSSSMSDAQSSSSDRQVNSLDGRTDADSESRDTKHFERPAKEIISKLDDEASPESVSVGKLESGRVELPASSTDTMREFPLEVNLKSSEVVNRSSSNEGGSSSPEETRDISDQHFNVSMEAPRVNDDEASENAKLKELESSQVGKAILLDLSNKNSDDIQLNIRLPYGVSLQEKFSVTDVLGMVKNFVDEKQEGSIGSYDLAIPYPRKVFTDGDLGKTLSELGLLNRQALIVVPHRGAAGHYKEGSFLPNQTISTNAVGSSNGSTEGYLPFMKRILSYMNPFSYLSGNSTGSTQESHNSTWQYGGNSTHQSNVTGNRRSYLVSPNRNTPPSGTSTTSNNRQRRSSNFGSNIHTLRHDEDDSKFNERNSFWNGNSTEYGGDNNDSK